MSLYKIRMYNVALKLHNLKLKPQRSHNVI